MMKKEKTTTLLLSNYHRINQLNICQKTQNKISRQKNLPTIYSINVSTELPHIVVMKKTLNH